MRKFIGLTRRNLLVYFKDKASILFSMLTPMIVFFLYILFLRQNYVDDIRDAASPLMKVITEGDIVALANGLLLAGIMGSALITVPYNCLITIVRDRERRIDYDICATPAGRVSIILSYFTAAALSAFIMTSVILGAGLLILCVSCNMYLSAFAVLRLVGAIFLGAVSSTAVFMVVMLFFNSSAASGAFLGILSAAAGFLIGAYIPLSSFSSGIESVCNLLPATGVTVLIRKNLLQGLLDHIDTVINGLDGGMFQSHIKNVFSFQSTAFGRSFVWNQTVIYVMVVTAAFLAAIGIIYPRIYKRK